MAEAMAFNRQCMGDIGGALAGYQLPDGQRKYVRFYHDNFDYYRDIDNISDVAVLHSYATMAFNIKDGLAVFKVPLLEVYDLVVIKFYRYLLNKYPSVYNISHLGIISLKEL